MPRAPRVNKALRVRPAIKATRDQPAPKVRLEKTDIMGSAGPKATRATWATQANKVPLANKALQAL